VIRIAGVAGMISPAPYTSKALIRSSLRLQRCDFAKVQQIAGGHKFVYLLSERHQFATSHRFASFA
jgi:hypothetical protein